MPNGEKMYKNFFKRLLDILISLVVLPFFVLEFIILAPIIYLEDRGTIFYNAERVGKGGKVFKMYKFRSMKMNSKKIVGSDGSTYSSDSDPRLTKIGRIMRKLSLDEAPQILNVLKGDMSLIGPRPTLPVVKVSEYDDVRKRRVTVRPGITGYSQAYFRNSATLSEKLESDAYYADNVTFLLDIKIILKTIATVVKRENIYSDTQTAVKTDN